MNEEILLNLLNTKGLELKKYTMRELVNKTKIPYGKLQKLLEELEANGKVYINSKGLISSFPPHLVMGNIKISNSNSGIINYNGKKYRLRGTNKYGILNQDTVIAKKTGITKNDIELVAFTKIVKRKNGLIVGEVHNTNGELYILDINNQIPGKIIIPYQELKKYVDGDHLQIKIDFPNVKGEYSGEVIKFIGHKDDPNLEVDSILAAHGLKIDFSEEALKEAEEANKRGIVEEDLIGRLDLRKFPNISIDPVNCKDRDDSFFLEKLPNGHKKLYVNIIDTTHYVYPGTAMWRDAEEKCFSSYIYNSSDPLFPRAFTYGIGSINQNEDRLSESFIIEFDQDNEIVDCDLVPSIIHTKKNATYDEVNKLLEEGIVLPDYEDLKDDILEMYSIAEEYYEIMLKRGFLDFASRDKEYTTDEKGNVTNVSNKKMGPAQRMVEVFMVLVDELITNFVFLPAPYRNHEQPETDVMESIIELLGEIGIRVKNKETFTKKVAADTVTELTGINIRINRNLDTAKQIQQIISQIKGHPLEGFISDLLIRKMKKAFYSPDNRGHYGLALKKYLQWTSPDRRFNDTILHYIIKEQRKLANPNLTNEEYIKISKNIYKYLKKMCEKISEVEVELQQAERESQKKAIEKLVNKSKELYNAQITFLNSKYILVKTDDGQEGLLDIGNLYRYNHKSRSYIHKKYKYRLQIGNLVKVKIKQPTEDGTLIFDIPKNEAKKLSLTLK